MKSDKDIEPCPIQSHSPLAPYPATINIIEAEETLSEPGGGPELPVTAVAATCEPGTENDDVPGGLGIGGRGKDIPMGGL